MLKMPRANSNGTSTGSSFPAANNFLQKKWNDRAYKLHREKVKTTKTKLDTTKPKECPHLHLNLKKIQMEEEKQALIDRDNRILLSKLTNVLRSDGSLDNWNYEYDARPKTLHAPQMQREQERIAKENERIMKRLTSTSGTYSFDKMEDDFLMHKYYKEMKAQETKTYELQARGFEEDSEHHQKAEKSPREEGEAAEGAEGEDKLPVVETKPPPPAPRRLVKRQSTKLPLLGVERKKAEEMKKKEAISKPSPYSDKEDAAKLFKAIKGMLKPEPVVIQVLARRTYAQRQQTISKFNDQYELELEEDFKSQLHDDYHDFISAMLARREEVDVITLNHALKGNDALAETFIEILCTRNNTALGVIKATYQRMYGVDIEEDIKEEVKGQLRHLFLALLKGSRNERMLAKADVAETDASELADEDSDRWTVNGGKLGELLTMASFDHMRAVFQQYDMLSDFNLIQELKEALSGDFRDAMVAMVQCLESCPTYLADQLHQVLIGEADESTLIRIMVTRAEVDLLQIRRAYRTKYKETLIDALENNCESKIKKALIQMILVHGSPKEDQDAAQKAETESIKQTHLPRVTPAPEAKSKLRGPLGNRDATLPADNPLVKSTRSWQPKSPVRKVVTTPRGLNKSSPSRISGSSKSTNRKPTSSKSKTSPPKTSSASSRQLVKPIPTKRQPPKPSQTQSKPASVKTPQKPSAQKHSTQKQTVSAKSQQKPKSSESNRQPITPISQQKPKSSESNRQPATFISQQKPKSSESNRTKSSKSVASVERTKQDDVVNENTSNNDDEVKETEPSSDSNAPVAQNDAPVAETDAPVAETDAPAGNTSPEPSKNKADDEIISSEGTTIGKDNNGPSISTEGDVSKGKDRGEGIEEDGGKKDGNNNTNGDNNTNDNTNTNGENNTNDNNNTDDNNEDVVRTEDDEQKDDASKEKVEENANVEISKESGVTGEDVETKDNEKDAENGEKLVEVKGDDNISEPQAKDDDKPVDDKPVETISKDDKASEEVTADAEDQKETPPLQDSADTDDKPTDANDEKKTSEDAPKAAEEDTKSLPTVNGALPSCDKLQRDQETVKVEE